jgi:energy-coupling factor transporter transmembrane protein EcfT
MAPANTQSIISQLFGFFFGMVAVINMGWGNDFFYGLFILLLSLAYYPFATKILLRYLSPLKIQLLKLVIGLFIIWTSLSVGELFEKIDMMRASF